MKERYKLARKAGIFGIIGNLFLMIIKGMIGFATKSQAMIADAGNSAGDSFASLMTYIGNKIASVPEDEDHNFGHGKAEYIFSAIISLSMIAVGTKLIYDSANSIIRQEVFQFSWILVIVCIITLMVKAFLYLYTKKIVKKYNNVLLKANNQDHRNDCIVTIFTLISILFGKFGIYWVDGVVGIGTAIWICITGLKILIESYNVLMDSAIDEKTKNKIINITKKFKEVKSVNSISSIPVGYKYIVVLTLDMDGNLETFRSHEVADKIEKKVKAIPIIHSVVIHVNPV